MALTQNQIIALIDEIQPAADYPANKMRPLLTDILAAAYGPLYIGGVPPSNTNDETFGYRPGSVGYDTFTKRYYVCQSATAGNAVWILIPADSNFTVAAYDDSYQTVTCGSSVSVVKCTNDNVINFGCKLLLPSNPYQGKTVIVYFASSIIGFSIRNSAGVDVVGASGITIPLGQQYTITYTGTAWEIVGVSNIAPATVSGVDVSDSGGPVTLNTTNLTFLGSAVTVAQDGTGTDITINPLSGVDVTRGATTVPAAQSIAFSGNFAVAAVGAGASVSYVSTTGIRQNGTIITTNADNVSSFNFIGTMFSEVPVVISNNNRADITLNGAKFLELTGSLIPTASNDSTQGYSYGSYARNTADLKRSFICRSNAVGAAIWDRITEDNGVSIYSPITSGTTVNQISYDVANVSLNSGSMTIAEYILAAPRYAYLGKKVYIYSFVNITVLRYKRADGTSYYGQALPAGSSIIMVCTNEGVDGGINQVWQRIG